MTIFSALALGLVVLFGMGAVAFIAVFAWLARGESDVNGDPERDAGVPEDEIAKAAASWDRGSTSTAHAMHRLSRLTSSSNPTNQPTNPSLP